MIINQSIYDISNLYTFSKVSQVYMAMEMFFFPFFLKHLSPCGVLQGFSSEWVLFVLHRPLGLTEKETNLLKSWGVSELLSLRHVHAQPGL